MSLISIVVLLLLVVIIIGVVSISIKKKTIVPAVILILVILLGYLGLTSPFCQTKSSFFKDDPMLAIALAKQQVVGNFMWSAPRWQVNGDKVTSCNAVYEILLLGTFGR